MASLLATRIASGAIASLLWAASCAPRSLGPAIDQYAAGRYPEALALLRGTEPVQRAWPVASRQRYALYRGLAELAVGNAQSARRWLSSAKRVDALNPELLGAADRGRLNTAWNSLGKMPGQTR